MKNTVYDRYLTFKDLLKKEFPDLGEITFFKMLGKLESWHYPKKRWKDMTLSIDEVRVYEWMVNNEYNPSTVYKWYRTLGENKEVQAKIKNKALHISEAKTYSVPFRRLTNLEAELMYHMKQSINRYLVR